MSALTAPVRIASIATAVPPFSTTQAEFSDWIRTNCADRLSPRSLRLISRLLAHPSIATRHFAVDNPDLMVDEDRDLRMERFTKWAVNLSANAVSRALTEAGLSPKDVSALVVNTCTGYICPGLSTYLVERLGLPGRIRCYDLVGSGCGGAIPNMQLCRALLQEDGCSVVVSVAVEICSATFEIGNDPSLLISNAIFGDGAAAAVLWKGPEGLEVVESASYFGPEHRDDIRYVYKEGALHNQLSVSLPGKAAAVVGALVREILAGRNLELDDVGVWVIHPGGEKVINSVQNELGLPEARVANSRKVLRNFGNMSSPSVWFVLTESLKRPRPPGEWCLMVAFGAGLSVHSTLMRV